METWFVRHEALTSRLGKVLGWLLGLAFGLVGLGVLWDALVRALGLTGLMVPWHVLALVGGVLMMPWMVAYLLGMAVVLYLVPLKLYHWWKDRATARQKVVLPPAVALTLLLLVLTRDVRGYGAAALMLGMVLGWAWLSAHLW